MTDQSVKNVYPEGNQAMPKKINKLDAAKKILAAAQKVIGRAGFQGANLAMIAKEAGLSKAALYLYFPNKENLFLKALEDGLDHMVYNAKEAAAKAETPVDKVKAVIASQLAFMERHQDFLKAFILERRGLSCAPGDKGFMRLREKRIAYTDFVAGIISQGIKEGIFQAKDPRKAAFFLIELIKAMVVGRIIGLSSDPLAQEITLVEDLFFKGIMAKDRR